MTDQYFFTNINGEENYRAVAGVNATLGTNDQAVRITSGAAPTIVTLPPAGGLAGQILFISISAVPAPGTVTVEPQVGNTLGGTAGGLVYETDASLVVQSDGVSNWQVVAKTGTSEGLGGDLDERVSITLTADNTPAIAAPTATTTIQPVVGATFQTTLPAGVAVGFTFTIVNEDAANALPINAAAGETLNGLGGVPTSLPAAGAAVPPSITFLKSSATNWTAIALG